ncbi:MAG: acyltransferase family protein, partial [Chloroflexota bacterium]|nr:acyltransferase family protein [Chloroflexota bacterium]
SILGLLLILFSVAFFDDSTRFPSFYALAPVVGTSLIVLFGSKETIIGKILSTKFLVGIGLISFSAYLWHQPLLAFARIRLLSEPSNGLMLSLSLLSIILAWFSWRYVEQPFRKKSGSIFYSRKAVFISSGFAMGMFATFGLYGHIQKGFSQRVSLPKLVVSDLHVRKYQKECFDFSMEKLESDGFFCHLGDLAEKPRVAVIGDSHALSFLPSLEALAQENESSLIFSGVSSCPPILNTFVLRDDSRRDVCNERNKHAHKEILDLGVETVVLIARWTNYTVSDISGDFMHLSSEYDVIPDKAATLSVFKDNLESTLKYYTENGLNVIIFHQPPVQKLDARSFYNYYYIISDRPFKEYLLEASVSKYDHVKRYSPVVDIIENKASIFPSVQSVNFSEALCGSGICKIGTPKRSYYLDDNHLSNYGASAVEESYRGILFR